MAIKTTATKTTTGPSKAGGTNPQTKAARTPKGSLRGSQSDAPPMAVATAEVAYTAARHFWPACRDGAVAYAAGLPGIQSVAADNTRRVVTLAGTKAGTAKAADRLATLLADAVPALRQQDSQHRDKIREQRKSPEGRAQRWADEQGFLTAYVSSGGAR